MSEIDEIRKLRDEVRQVKEAVTKPATKGPTEQAPKTPAAPSVPAAPASVGEQLAAAVERYERERDGGPVTLAMEPEVKWWFDRAESQAIQEAADRIRQREEWAAAKERVPVPPAGAKRLQKQEAALLRSSLRGVPAVPSLVERETPAGLRGVLADVGERKAAGIPGIGVPPPGFESVQRPRTLGESLERFVDQVRRRWGGTYAGGVGTGEMVTWTQPGEMPPVGQGLPLGVLSGPGVPAEMPTLAIHPTSIFRKMKSIPLVGGIVSAVEMATQAAVTGLAQLDYIPKMGMGRWFFRNLQDPREVDDEMWLVRGQGVLGLEDKRLQAEVYDALQDPALSDAERGSIESHLSRMFYTGPEGWLPAIERFKTGEDPDRVIEEEMDPIREMMGELVFSLDWPMGAGVGILKETGQARRIEKFWKVPVQALPDWVAGANKPTKSLMEKLTPWVLTRRSKAQAVTNVVQGAVMSTLRVHGNDIDGLRAALRGLKEEGGLKLFMESINAHPESEGARVFGLLTSEEGFVDDLAKLLKGKARAADLSEMGEEAAKGLSPFSAAEFLDETESLVGRYADDIFKPELDAIKAPVLKQLNWVNNVVKSRMSDFWMGLNPGYGWRNLYNNLATLTVDNLIDGLTFAPGKRREFLDLWFGKDVRPSAMHPGLGGTPAQPARTVTGEMRGIGAAGQMPIHRFAATAENWSREVAWTTALRRWARKRWHGLGPDFPQTLDKWVKGLDPSTQRRIYEIVSNNIGDTEGDLANVAAFLKTIGGPDDIIEEASHARPVTYWTPPGAELRPWVVDEVQGAFNELAEAGDMQKFTRHLQGVMDDLVTEYMVGRARDGFLPNRRTRAWQLVDDSYMLPHNGDMPTPFHLFTGYVGRAEDGLEWTKDARRTAQLETMAAWRKVPLEELEVSPEIMPWRYMHDEEKWIYTRRVLDAKVEAGKKLTAAEQAFMDQQKYVPMFRTPAEVPRGPLNAVELNEKVGEFMQHLQSGKAKLLPDTTIDNKWIARTLKVSDEEAQQIGDRLWQWGVVGEAWTPEGRRLVKAVRLPDQIDYVTLLGERLKLTQLKNGAGGEIAPSARGLEEWFQAQHDFFTGARTDMPIFEDFISPLGADELADAALAKQIDDDMMRLFGIPGERMPEHMRRVKEADIEEARRFFADWSDEEIERAANEWSTEVDGYEDKIAKFERDGERAIPSRDIARSFWDIRNQEALRNQPKGPKTIAQGSLPRTIRREMPDGTVKVEFSGHTKSYREDFKWDQNLLERQTMYPDFFNELTGAHSRRAGYEMGDWDMWRELVNMRMRGRIDFVDEWRSAALDLQDKVRMAEIEGYRRGILPGPEVSEAAVGGIPGQEQFFARYLDEAVNGRVTEKSMREALDDGYINEKQYNHLRGIVGRDEAIMGADHSRQVVQQNNELIEGIVKKLKSGEITETELRTAAPDLKMADEEIEAILRMAATPDVDFMGIGNPARFGPYHSDALGSVIADEIKFVKAVLAEGGGAVKLPPRVLGTGGDDLAAGVVGWLKNDVASARAAMKMAGEMYAKELADFALLDYGRRHNFDLWTALVMPYPYWRTYTGVNWLQRMGMKPWAINTYRNLRETVRQVRDDMPTRLKDKGIEIEAPWLDNLLGGTWSGNRLMVDVIPLLFAPAETWPLNAIMETQWEDPEEAQNGLQEMTGFMNAMEMRPFPHIDWGIKLLSGEGLSKEGYLFSQSGFIQGLTALMWEHNMGREGLELDASWLPESVRDALGWGDTVQIQTRAGGFAPEAGARRIARQVFGWTEQELPSTPYFNELYWPQAHLAFMVAEGEIDLDTYYEVRDDRIYNGNTENPIWQIAYNRAALQKAIPGITGFLLGQRWDMYPEAEKIIRENQEYWKTLLWSPEQPEGTSAAGREYKEAHPGMYARSDIFPTMPPSAWYFKNPDGTFDRAGFNAATAEYEAAGGMPAVVHEQYRLHEYYKRRNELQAQQAEVNDHLITDLGFVPGTRPYRVAQDYFREVQQQHRDAYADLWEDYEATMPYGASPEERLAWYKEQRAADLANVYYGIKAEDFAGPDGEVDFDAWREARQAALDALPSDERLEVERYIHRYSTPEEEAMAVVEDGVYEPLRSLMWEAGQLEGAEQQELQDKIAVWEENLDGMVRDALGDGYEEMRELHPEWGVEELGRYTAFDVPAFDAWRRAGKSTREAMEGVFRDFYWDLDQKVRRTLYDKDLARSGGVPGNYMGPEFEQFREEHKTGEALREGLAEVSDGQLMTWLSQLGQAAILEAEGFTLPGREVRAGLRGVPGYVESVTGEGFDWSQVQGRAWGKLGGVGPAPTEVGEPAVSGTPAEEEPLPDKTAKLQQAMIDAVADVAVKGEELVDARLPDPTFAMPAEAVLNDWAQMSALEDGYYALPEGDARDAYLEEHPELRDLWDKYLGDPDSPQSLFWALYHGRAGGVAWSSKGASVNPMGRSLVPAELKDNPFVKMVFDAMDTGQPAADNVYLEARLAFEDYVAEHGEELLQAREEMIGYLALLEPALEDLQEEYYTHPQGSQERRDLLAAHPELGSYWDLKRQYKGEHPVMVRYYFPENDAGTTYQSSGYSGRRYGGGGGGGYRPPTGAGGNWAAFQQQAGPEIIFALTEYWNGRGALTETEVAYLKALYKSTPFGVASFAQWLDMLRSSWQGSIPQTDYEIPMRERPIIVRPGGAQSGNYWPAQPTSRVRYLLNRGY